MSDLPHNGKPAASASEDEVAAFLSTPGVVGSGGPRIYETHIARVFVGPQRALKIKRRVNLAFVDFRTLEQRHAACMSELAVNRDNAPQIYRGIVPITREHDGRLAIAGEGPPVDWAVDMRAFPDSDLLSERARVGPLAPALMKKTADSVFHMHQRARRAIDIDAPDKMRAVVTEVATVSRDQGAGLPVDQLAAWQKSALSEISRHCELLDRRVRLGSFRHCHGDLHLANIVVWNGEPTLFDALEFSIDMATVDTLYDLAFLLMDLAHYKQRQAANIVLNRYLWRTGTLEDLDALALMPLYLSARAGIRAMVAATRAASTNRDAPARLRDTEQSRHYLAAAMDFLTPKTPRLIGVGGLSGTGKSTLAAALAPQVSGPLGALHLRSDLERKSLMGVDELDRLPKESYTPELSARVYERVYARAMAALRAGQSVIADAVFSAPAERNRLAEIAASFDIPFDGLWLQADAPTLHHRVEQRRADASDATREVVDRQLTYAIGRNDWTTIAAGGNPGETQAAALSTLGLLPTSD